MIEPARIESPDEGNGGAEVARVAARYWEQDRARSEELDRLIASRPTLNPYATRTICRRGHPLDGLKQNHGRTVRFCRTCHRERMRAAREIR